MNNIPYEQISVPAGYSGANLENMYPDIYRVVYPKVQNICNAMDIPGNPDMYPYPRREAVERMTDEIYDQVVVEIGDPEYYQSFGRDDREPVYGGTYGYYGVPGYGPGYGFGRRRLLRDLISILLIRQLVGRRPGLYGYGYSGYGLPGLW